MGSIRGGLIIRMTRCSAVTGGITAGSHPLHKIHIKRGDRTDQILAIYKVV